MSKSPKYPFAQVMPVALKIQEALSPFCQVIEIAGSLRRKRPQVADIELVAIPLVYNQTNLFGDISLTMNHLLIYLDNLLTEGKIQKGRAWGSLYRNFQVTTTGGRVYPVDLFMADERNFGNTLAIRTGSSKFSTHLMAHLNAQGLSHKNGYLWTADGNILDCPTESAFFEAINHPFVPPEDRSDERWRRYIIKEQK